MVELKSNTRWELGFSDELWHRDVGFSLLLTLVSFLFIPIRTGYIFMDI